MLKPTTLSDSVTGREVIHGFSHILNPNFRASSPSNSLFLHVAYTRTEALCFGRVMAILWQSKRVKKSLQICLVLLLNAYKEGYLSMTPYEAQMYVFRSHAVHPNQLMCLFIEMFAYQNENCLKTELTFKRIGFHQNRK